ncbi:hypothetical protein C6P40_005288 [Pichia californica]|uniref:ER membrane protein complex subunit 5 n=1 Tax=Pichia californica TaxID=460514 RepID=A0A9P6WQ70_9ASCO|nr:hypothetical protein C6P42_000099 [[Candida] californica]KAG0691061.1 hypothetical protein C6P40_005288 [[Candida] californica]
MFSFSTVLSLIGFFLLANAAYSRYELNQLAFIVSENSNSTISTINTLPIDIILEIFLGSFIIIISILTSFFTTTENSSSSICNDSLFVKLKNGNWIIDSKSNLYHPLRLIDLDRANNEIEKSGKGSYQYLDNRVNFANFTKRALYFQNWYNSSLTKSTSTSSKQ